MRAGLPQRQTEQNRTRAFCQDSNYLSTLQPCPTASLLQGACCRSTSRDAWTLAEGLQSASRGGTSLINHSGHQLFVKTYTLSVKAGGEALRAVKMTTTKTAMRKRARTAPITAPATAMEFDLSSRDWSGTEERRERVQYTTQHNRKWTK